MIDPTGTLSLRCSSLPLASLCPASALPADVPLCGGGPAADLGTAVHAWLADRIRGRDDFFERDDWAYYALTVDPDELARLTSWAWSAWCKVRHWFRYPLVEMKLSFGRDGLTLTGHPDIIERGNDLRILDWKSGRLDSDYQAQMLGYAWLALQEWPEYQEVWAGVLRIRDQTIDGWTWTRAEVERWFDGLAWRLRGGGYNPGPHCAHCPRAATCEAKTALLAQSLRALRAAADEDEDVVLIPGDLKERGRAWAIHLDGAKLLEDLAATIRAMVRADVSAHGGRLPTGDGRELALVEQQQRKIDYQPASEVLVETLGLQVLGSLIYVAKAEVEKAVRDAVPRGKKKEAVAELWRRLEQAGAVTSTTITRLEVRRNGDTPELPHEPPR